MYRCTLCAAVVPPRHQKLRHAVRRPDGSTARELDVCSACHRDLARGLTPAQVVALNVPEPEPDLAPVVVGAAPRTVQAPTPQPAPASGPLASRVLEAWGRKAATDLVTGALKPPQPPRK